MRKVRLAPLWLGALLGACATGTPPSKVASAVEQSLGQGQPGYQLAMQAIGCWAGGLWAEAEGYLPAERRAVTEVRCRQVLRRAFGDGQDRYQPMRDIDRRLVEELAQKAAALSPAEEREPLQRLLPLAADAEREALEARHAAVKIRHDLNDPRELVTLEAEEQALLRGLHASEALGRLLKADLGPFTDDARVIGLLVAIGRLERVRMLPRHLRPHAVEEIARLVFGDGPALEEDLSKPLSSEAAVQYLVDLARGAGHPVPDSVTSPMGRSLMGFAGVLRGLSARVSESLAKLSKDADPTLRRIAAAVVNRIDQEYQAAQEAASRPLPPPRQRR